MKTCETVSKATTGVAAFRYVAESVSVRGKIGAVGCGYSAIGHGGAHGAERDPAL